MNSILNELGINDFNYGACTGKGKWSQNKNTKTLDSFNPSNGDKIALIIIKY